MARFMSAGRWVDPTVYVVAWPDGVVKIGWTMYDRRWKNFVARGARLVRLYRDGDIHLEEVIQRWVAERYPAAFSSKAESLKYLGGYGGWTECFKVPVGRIDDLFPEEV
jgi:hypothetical protein